MPTRDYNFAVEHIKKYPCWEVWERIKESIDTINTSTSKMLDELNEVIDNRIKKELSTPDITHPLPQILNELVKILIKDSDKNRGCGEYISIDTQGKWVVVQTDRVYPLTEHGNIQDLEAFERIICETIRDEHYRNNVSHLLREYEKIKGDVKTFTDQLSDISYIAEHRHKLKGKCKACPRILWVFSP